jgi:two-component system cell cycle sensor histidine kinase PleC
MDEVKAEAGLAVLSDGVPVGLAGRRQLMQSFAHPVTHALYESRPLSLLMQRDPLVVDATTSVDRVTELIATEKESALDDGFVVVDQGRYAGIGTITALLNLSVSKAREQIHELDVARAEAERASKSKSRFLANLSHELRTPLNSILGFSELIQSGVAGDVTAKQAEYLNDIQTSGRRLLLLINDLLDLSRAEAGRLELEEDEVELGLLVEEARRTLIPRARSKGLSLNFDADCEVDVHVDERKIIQVLLNLVNNAVKFTPEGGAVTLGDEIRPDGGVNLHVVDTGHGIPEGDMQRILEPFGRGRDSAIRQAEGAGIGLALTKVLVELHGGTLDVTSTVGVGSRFTVRLPRSRVVRYRGTVVPSLAACGERG